MAYPHWEYLLALDADLEVIARYVEFDSANYNTFSIEFVRLFLAACAEIDVLAKVLCKQIDPSKPGKNIGNYRQIIQSKYPNFHTIEITVPRYGLSLTPWRSWGADNTPSWWSSYNKVKHERASNYSEANLKNSLDAMAGLFALVLYYYKHALGLDLIEPIPKLLSMNRGAEIIYTEGYKLPDF